MYAVNTNHVYLPGAETLSTPVSSTSPKILMEQQIERSYENPRHTI
jgi:hypothetical protein